MPADSTCPSRGLLLGSGQVFVDQTGNFAIVGELALTGETRPIKGILAMALQAVAQGRDGMLVSTANASEAAVVEGFDTDVLTDTWTRCSLSAV